VRSRQAAFDARILSERPQETNYSNMWWGQQPRENLWGGDDNVFTMLRAGHSVREVERWQMTQRIIDIYALIYEAELWEGTRGAIQTTEPIQQMVEGIDDVLSPGGATSA